MKDQLRFITWLAVAFTALFIAHSAFKNIGRQLERQAVATEKHVVAAERQAVANERMADLLKEQNAAIPELQGILEQLQKIPQPLPHPTLKPLPQQ